MSIAQIHNLSGDRDSTFLFSCQWLQDNIPVDLAGWTGQMQLKQGYNCTGVAAEAISTDSSMILGPSGAININLSALQMANLDANNYVYSLNLSSGDYRTTLIKGSFLAI